MNEVIKKKKRKTIIISVVVILLIICLIEGIYLLINHSNKIDDEDNQIENNDDVVIDDDIYINLNRVEKVSTLSEREKLYSKDINSGDDEVIDYTYDGYYITKVDDAYYLKRNKNVVSKIEETENFVLYKDKNDSNSKYVAVKYVGSEIFEFTSLDNDTYASGWTNDSKTLDNYSIIFNVHTGEYKKFVDNEMISIIYNNNDEHYMMWSDKSYLLSNKDFSIVDTGEYEIVGDSFAEQEVLGLFSNSSKYIVAMKDSKYGLIDYNGKVVIEAMYEDLYTISDDLLYACKDGKYGIINSSNETIIEFKYDSIVAIDNYYVVLIGTKLGVLDKTGKEVVPVDIDILVEESDDHSVVTDFFAYHRESKIVVEYYDPDSNGDEYNSNYIIIDQDGKYEKRDDITNKYYNFSESYYYIKEKDDVVSFYDQEDNLLGDIKCGGAYDFNFVDQENLSFICFSNDTEVKYFNVKDKKEVTEEEIDDRYDEFEYVGELAVFEIDSKKIVISFATNGELIFRLDKDDNISFICDNYYKVTRSNGKIEYYKLNLD